MKDDFLNLYSKPLLVLFGFTLLLYAVNMGLYNYFVWSDEVYATQNGGITNVKSLKTFRLADLLRLVSSPVTLFARSIWVAFVIQLTLLLLSNKVKLKAALKVSVICQNILILADITKTFFFLVISPTKYRDSIDFFYPFSLLNWIDDKDFARNNLNMLAAVNVFEIIFIVTVGYFLTIIFAVNKVKATVIFGGMYICIVALIYGTLWFIK